MSLQSKNEFQIFSLHPVVQETIITDLLKTGRKHMHQVSPNEFCMLQSDLAPGLAGLFSLAENVTSFSVTERIRLLEMAILWVYRPRYSSALPNP